MTDGDLEMILGGGPAFPRTPDPDERLAPEDGMTLVDYFAGQALISMGHFDLSHSELGKAAYEQAQAMLLARKAWFNKAKAAYASKATVGTKLNTTG